MTFIVNYFSPSQLEIKENYGDGKDSQNQKTCKVVPTDTHPSKTSKSSGHPASRPTFLQVPEPESVKKSAQVPKRPFLKRSISAESNRKSPGIQEFGDTPPTYSPLPENLVREFLKTALGHKPSDKEVAKMIKIDRKN